MNRMYTGSSRMCLRGPSGVTYCIKLVTDLVEAVVKDVVVLSICIFVVLNFRFFAIVISIMFAWFEVSTRVLKVAR